MSAVQTLHCHRCLCTASTGIWKTCVFLLVQFQLNDSLGQSPSLMSKSCCSHFSRFLKAYHFSSLHWPCQKSGLEETCSYFQPQNGRFLRSSVRWGTATPILNPHSEILITIQSIQNYTQLSSNGFSMFFLSSTIHVRYGFPNKQFKDCKYAYVKNSYHRPTLYNIYIYI